MIYRILAIMSGELKVAARNRWLATSVALMTVFGLILAFAGSAPAGTVGVDALTVTVSNLGTLSVYMVPLIALLLSYDGLAGEVERGSLPLLLTYPVARGEVLAAKFLAQLAVLALAIFIGFGAASAAVWFASDASAAGFWHLLRLQWSAVVLGAAFLGLGAILSVSTRQSATAASLAVALWLIAVVMYDIGLLGALVADDGGVFTSQVFPWLLLANPADAFRVFNLAALDASVTAGSFSAAAQSLDLPWFAPVVSMFAWPVVSLGLAALVLRRVEP